MTPEEWQEAVDSAALLLAIDSATRYGLVTWKDARGAPIPDYVNVERCEAILERGRVLGVRPAPLSILLKRIRVGEPGPRST